MGMTRIWARRLIRGPVIGTNRKDCSPRDEGYLISIPGLVQFIPLRARTSNPSKKEGSGISLTRAVEIFRKHKNYAINECYLITRKGKILRSVRRPNIGLKYGIYGALLSLGGSADDARFIITVRNYSGNLTHLRLYKLPSKQVVRQWEKWMEAHRTPEEIAADKEREERAQIQCAATEEVKDMLNAA